MIPAKVIEMMQLWHSAGRMFEGLEYYPDKDQVVAFWRMRPSFMPDAPLPPLQASYYSIKSILGEK